MNKAFPTRTIRSGGFAKVTVRPRASVTVKLLTIGTAVAGTAVAGKAVGGTGVAGTAVDVACTVQAALSSRLANNTMESNLLPILFSFLLRMDLWTKSVCSRII
jgi:hypothetical protein